MSFATIALFLVVSFGLGFTVTSFVKNSENFLERNLMRLGIGLSLFPFLAIILNIVRIPADYRLILALSLAYPIYYLFRNIKKFKLSFKITKSDLYTAAMLVIFSLNLYVYASGAFNYPYLEDDDSWSHAIGIKYYAIEKNAFKQEAGDIRYMNPYHPTYDVLLGILHQTNDTLYWIMKFFNAFIVALSTIFFYFFVKEFSQNRNVALFAAFALFSIPAFMSHFIWAISLSVPLYFVVFYALERIKYDSRWWIVSGVSMFTALTSSPTHSTYFAIFFGLYLITKIVLERRILLKYIVAGILGAAFSFVFWWIPMLMRHGFLGVLEGIGFNIANRGPAMFAGTGDRVYTFNDFFIAKMQNMINNPIGIGVVLSILALIGIIFIFLKFGHLINKENHWMVITFVWFLLTLYAVNSTKFTIKLSPFRAWMLLAIPVCILAAYGAITVLNVARRSAGRIGMIVVLTLLLTGVYYTSTQQKVAVNTAQWPPGAFWTSGDEIGLYVWIKDNLPKNSNVFTFKNNAPIIGMDMFTCHWCQNVKDYQINGFNESAQQNYNWMKERNYQYLVIDGQTVRKFGVDESNEKVQELIASQLFSPVINNNGGVVLRLA